jgi:hypothetical protein
MADTKRYTIDNKPEGDKSNDRLSSLLPRPNIVRIEVLDGNSRDRFLKSQTSTGDGTNIYSITNEMRKSTIGSVYTGNRAKEKVFYGFLDPKTDSTFNLTSEWSDSSMGGDVGGAIKKVIANAPGIGDMVNTGINIGSSFNEIANRTLGLNTTATGAATMQEFKGVKTSEFNVSCIWYLPEQEKLANFSLKVLYRMLYPTQIAQDKVGKMVGDAVSNIVDRSIPIAQQAVTEGLTTAGADGLAAIIPPPPPPNADGNSPPSTVASVIGKGASAVSGVTTAVNNFFGQNTTINPLPVRVCIGQHIDLEPLVIKGVSTKFSKETFISEINGRHLPLYAWTTINFGFWLTPTPNMEFASILGSEIFGDEMATFK